jgi:chaperonin GroES|tara:strand:+ start:703 stop:996 length:294 start_codon:yes stop_codon:yes gene_type:complete
MIQPVGDRVLIQLAEQEKESSGGIILSAGAIDRIKTGVILAVGEGSRTSYGNLIPISVKVGDTVLFSQFTNMEKFEDNGEEFYILPEKGVMAVLEDD